MIALRGGADSLQAQLEQYLAAWKAFIVVNHLEPLERSASLAALSWKVEHKVSLYANLRLIGDKASQVHIGTVNDRFIAMAVLKEPHEGFRVIKIMERRAAASDPLGLDSIDFKVDDVERTFALLKATGARVEKERNAVHEWVSLRFGKNHEYEAKFIDHSLLDIAIAELEDTKRQLDK